MDINAAIDQLGLNANTYKLTQSVPPHTIVEWSGPNPQPTQAELEAAWVLCQANAYQDQRAPEYPPAADLADGLYWASKGDSSKLDAYYAACEAVKAKYPKESS